VPARLINIKYITIRAEKVASPVTALHPDNPQNCPFSLGSRHHAGGGLCHGHKQHAQKNW